jgi:hypothetical protein
LARWHRRSRLDPRSSAAKISSLLKSPDAALGCRSRALARLDRAEGVMQGAA